MMLVLQHEWKFIGWLPRSGELQLTQTLVLILSFPRGYTDRTADQFYNLWTWLLKHWLDVCFWSRQYCCRYSYMSPNNTLELLVWFLSHSRSKISAQTRWAGPKLNPGRVFQLVCLAQHISQTNLPKLVGPFFVYLFLYDITPRSTKASRCPFSFKYQHYRSSCRELDRLKCPLADRVRVSSIEENRSVRERRSSVGSQPSVRERCSHELKFYAKGQFI